MADPVRPLLDGGASAVEDNRPGRKAPGGTERASGMPPAAPSAPAAQSSPGGTTPVPPESSPEGTTPRARRDGAGSPAPLTAKSLTDAQSLTADELPDGLVIADDAGRVVVYNRAAVRLTGIAATDAIGKYVYDVLPFRDDDGRDWWMFVDPYNGLATRTRHPERSLFLADGTAGGLRGSSPGAVLRCSSRSATCATQDPARCAAW